MTLFRVEWREGIALAHMNRPPVNALDRELLQAIGDGFKDLLEEGPEAVVLTGEGPCFSAGADLFSVIEGSTEYIEGTVPALTAAFGSLFEFPRPVVAAVNGHAIAGGAIIACACDYRIMGMGTGKIGISELRVGVPFPTYAIEIMRFAVGPEHIQELTYLAKAYDPEVAITKGLIDEIVEPNALMDRAFEIARQLAKIPSASFEAMKTILRAPTLERIARFGPEHDAKARKGWASDEVRASVTEFLAKTFGAESVKGRG